MSKVKLKIMNIEELEEAILKEKEKGTSDVEIGKIYNVNFKFIEKLITKSKGINVSQIKKNKVIKNLQPKDFNIENTTIWSFKNRGNWATHSGEYRGNWSPYIPRNIILKYSEQGDLVLDNFCGAGTTAVECKILGRRCIAIDINEKAIELAKINLNFDLDESTPKLFNDLNNQIYYEPQLIIGDARDLRFLEDASIDLICSHPPYANIIQYTESKDGDLSHLRIDEFLIEMEKVANESYRVLKPGKKCAVLIGDTRKNKRIVPLGFKLIDVYLKAGFELKELVIKIQHNCKTTGFWYTNSIKHNFLLLAHEYLPIFEKPVVKNKQKVQEDETKYSTINFSVKKNKSAKKIDQLETTSVWILPNKDFESTLNKNIIDRYSINKNFKIIEISNKNIETSNSSSLDIIKNSELLFIKTITYSNEISSKDVQLLLEKLKSLLSERNLIGSKLNFVVVQTMDLRKNGFIEPMAKKIIDEITNTSLILKEIIIVTKDKKFLQKNEDAINLEIVHQYLLVFEVKK
ncbi:MAG: DNA methyltransferase [Ignavibacterium sp.]|nr:DNA methyltransferase [Ignavibacterium sp.]